MRPHRCCLLALLITITATLDGHAQQPQTPPVEKPPVIAPAVVQPSDDIPVVDPLRTPLAINVAIRGATQGDLVVTAPVGQLLELTLTGDGAAESGPVFWSYSENIPDRSERDEGHWVGMSFPPESSGKAYLIQAAVNGSEKGPPLVAMRWLVVSGKGPIPPPEVKPPAPKPEVPPVVESGKRSVIIVRESGDDKPWFSRLAINLRDGTASKYLADHGHTLTILDDEQITDGDGWKTQLVGMTLPVLFVIDSATNTVVCKESIKTDATADNIIETVKRNGG